MAEIGRNTNGSTGSGSMTREQREYAIRKKEGGYAAGLTQEEREVAERCGSYTGSNDWFACKRQVDDRQKEDLTATVQKAREALLKDIAARQAKYDKAMKAADAHAKAGDKAKAAAELQKAYDAADESGECLQVAKKAASLDLQEFAAKALWGARNIAYSAAASEHVAKTAESLGFDDIAIWAKEDAEKMRQEEVSRQHLIEKERAKDKELRGSKIHDRPAPQDPEIRKSPLVEVLTDPMTLGFGALAYGAYLESQEGKKSRGGKTKRKH